MCFHKRSCNIRLVLLELLPLQLGRLKIIDKCFYTSFIDVADHFIAHVESPVGRYVEENQLVTFLSGKLPQLPCHAAVWPREETHWHFFDVLPSSDVVLIRDFL